MRRDTPASVYLDSCTFIHVLNRTVGYEPIEQLLQLADAGRVAVMVSPVSLSEVRGGPYRSGTFDAVKDARALALVDNPRFVLVEYDRTIALKSRDLAVQFGLKPADAVHLASAVVAGAEVFMTCDKGFPRGQLVEQVWVDEPYPYGGPNLFSGGPSVGGP